MVVDPKKNKKDGGGGGDPMTNEIDWLVSLVKMVICVFNQCEFSFVHISANAISKRGSCGLFVVVSSFD